VTSPSRGHRREMRAGCLVGCSTWTLPSNEQVNKAPGVRITPLTHFMWPTSYLCHRM